MPLEHGLEADGEFRSWKSRGQLSTPLYFRRFVERWPDRCARAVVAVADAPPGGVLVHCAKGSDRTGLVVALVLALVGVPAEVIADDYEMTASLLRSPTAAALGYPDDALLVEALLRPEGRIARDVVIDMLTSVDVAVVLAAGGLTDEQIGRLQRRLVEA